MDEISVKLFNQHDYKNIPYNYKGESNATIKSAGCGVCCMCTVLSHMGIDVSVSEMAEFSVGIGARVDGGTDMRLLGIKTAEKYHLQYSISNDAQTLSEHLEHGGIAIANVGGNRDGYKGIFSDVGHYIVVTGKEKDGMLKIYDVGEYDNKYKGSMAWRMNFLRRDGKYLLCTEKTLEQDTLNRNPNYYLFGRDKMTSIEAIDILKKHGIISDENYWKASLQYIKNIDSLLIKMAEKLGK